MSATTQGDTRAILRRLAVPGAFVIAVFIALFYRSGQDEGALWALSGETMGTTWSARVTPSDDVDKERVGEALTKSLAAVNQRMSTWQKDSELSLFNQHKSTIPFEASEELVFVLTEARRISDLSDGAFDVTVGPLVNAWGFGPKGLVDPPAEDVLVAQRAKVGYKKLEITAGRLTKTNPDLYVDLSAIAKGYGVDRAAKALDDLGFDSYMVEVGGEVRARGSHPSGRPWNIGIETPDGGRREVFTTIALTDMSMATSGDYRNFYEKEGKRFSHTIDPRKGAPVAHRLASVSVLHESCMTADALATTLNVLGPDEGLALAEKEKLAALFLIKRPDGTFEQKATTAFVALQAQAPKETP